VNPSIHAGIRAGTENAPSDTAGDVTYTASGFAAGASVNIALFPSTGADAPVAPDTFTPVTADTAGDAAGEGTTNTEAGFITAVNGIPIAGTDEVDGVTPVAGALTFTINSFSVDGTIPVVWTGPATSTPLLVNANGTPQTGFEVGIGGSTTWTSLAATTGDYYLYVQTVSPSTDTFVGCVDDDFSECYTFTYGVDGSFYYYDDDGAGVYEDAPLSETNFALYLSGATPPFVDDPVVQGDQIYVEYNGATNPAYWYYDDDVPAAPTAVTATNAAGTVTITWTAPSNPDVLCYEIERATVTSGVVGAFSDIATSSVCGTEVDGDTTVAPLTTTTDTPPTGATYEYEVAAIADDNNGDYEGPFAQSNEVSVAGVPTATITGLFSDSTAYGGGSGTDCYYELCVGAAFQVTFNEPATVSAGWSLSLQSEYYATATLNSTNTHAVASGDTVTYTVTSTVPFEGTYEGEFYVGDGYYALIYAETGVTATSGGAPWNLAGSATVTPLSENPADESDYNTGLSIVFDGTNDDTYTDGPYVNSVVTGGAGLASVNLTCESSELTVTVYDAAGNTISTPTACTGGLQNIPVTIALASGDTIQANQYYLYNDTEYVYDWPTMTTAYLIP
jgi:hypothetical protein